MPRNKPNILVLSSVSPSIGPAVIGEQYYEALRRKGLNVDFMTKNPEPGHPEYLYVVKRENFIGRIISKVENMFRWALVGGRVKESGYNFFYTYENFPPVPSRRVVNAIKKQYDLVIVVFWQGLLSFETIEQIYDKLHCQIHFLGVDYSQMSGGCHFTGDCQRYKTGCGCCPAFHSKNKDDFTAWNVRYRERVYEKVKPIVYGNLYMHQFYNQSYLLKDAQIEVGIAPIIDTDVFYPIDNVTLREKYNIPSEKRHLIFFGCQSLADERKGIKYLLDAFNVLYKMMGVDADSVLVISAGRNFDVIKGKIPFDAIGYGIVPMNQLPELFSLATCFVCPSVNDAGPMMVNQSLCCGTPVVGFDMGATKQVVKDKGSGVCVPLKDSKALSDGMYKVLMMSDDEYQRMSKRAREIALQTSSYEAQANTILSIYEKYTHINE